MMHFGQLSHYWDYNPKKILNYLVSRKYNGWSVIWDGGYTRGMRADDVPWYYKGKDKNFVSTGLWSLGRENKPKVIHAPDYFLDCLPKKVPAHGEIWYNDRLDLIKRTVTHKAYHRPMWQNLKMIGFQIKPYHLWDDKGLFDVKKDLPSDFSGSLDFLRGYKNDVFDVIDTEVIRSTDDIKRWQQKAIDNKWEGLMFGNPRGEYECNRSYNNLKWKQDYETEAIIYGYFDGKKKNLGQAGSLKGTLVWDDKILSIYGGLPHHVGKEVEFKISGLEKDERPWEECYKKYPKGKVIKVKFYGVSVHGIPQSPNIYRGM